MNGLNLPDLREAGLESVIDYMVYSNMVSPLRPFYCFLGLVSVVIWWVVFFEIGTFSY